MLDFRDEHQGRQKHHGAGQDAYVLGTDQTNCPVTYHRAQGAADACQADMHRHIGAGLSRRGIFGDP